ncbi:MAG: RnfH family protein [Legionellales bacterium RIFCSPHIGHO2_12_FULL_35_11]|nr:MAG: RnfH family protein [Legionellales bacterium RIFCSPHIGHO2_12_FULL_35_11]
MVNVELIFVASDQIIFQKRLCLQQGVTVADAITASGIVNQYSEVSSLPVGIFSTLVSRETLLSSGDRVEIYRPLTIDPKEKRRQRSLKKKR